MFDLSFNRTIVELKYTYLLEQNGCEGAFNRTIVELKWNARNYRKRRFRLLIEPLWNWNVKGSNTSLWHSQLLIEPLWNWNIIIRSTTYRNSTFNRTIVELKLHIIFHNGIAGILLIELFWNCNIDDQKGLIYKLSFKSNHCGIEI